MRQRRVKNLEEKYAAYESIIEYAPETMRGNWRNFAAERIATDARVYLEIGCGKGRFITEAAKLRPNDFFIAVEGHKSVLLRALEKAAAAQLANVIFIPKFIQDLREWFADGEVDGIYLNFSDPLPKACSAKKRLTHRSKLKQYFDVLSEQGSVEFKTDNTGLFNFSVMEVAASDLRISEMVRDLHNSYHDDDNIRTEYEDKFSGLGEKIKWMRIVRITERRRNMSNNFLSMAAFNGRNIPEEDRIFGISGRAKESIKKYGRDKVINATVGALLDDDGELIVLRSVDEALRDLSPAEYAEYAPISGTPGFRRAILKAALGDYSPNAHIGVVATPGGTGALRNAIANYTFPADKILVHDWHWSPYDQIAAEQSRSVETFAMFNSDGNFNIDDFEYKVRKLLRIQERLLIILNTPANNPTGYSLSGGDWERITGVLNTVSAEKPVTLLVDIAYIDFAGDKSEVRDFLPKLENLNDNILPVLAYSASKTFTFYGLRCGAMICLAKHEEVADEFVRVTSFSARATWSNSPRAPQAVIEKIYANKKLLVEVDVERAKFRDMLIARGRAFEETAKQEELEIVPFRAGFFISVPCDDPISVSKELEKDLAFVVPLAKGVRVSVASISEEKCRRLPAMIKKAMRMI